MQPTTACKTIGHAISRASAGDSIMVAAATYKENLTIGISLKVLGASASTTIIDGGGVNTVVKISSNTANVTLSNLTIQNGLAIDGGGIRNNGTLTVSHSVIRGNTARAQTGGEGGGIYNAGTLTLNASTVSGNKTGSGNCGFCATQGGGIWNSGSLTANNSTISGNTLTVSCGLDCGVEGGGIYSSSSGKVTINSSTLSGNTAKATPVLTSAHTSTQGGGLFSVGAGTITNSTIAANTAQKGSSTNRGGGILGDGALTISNSTISGNSASGASSSGAGIFSSSTTIQNSIVANNTGGKNCFGTMTSKGYNLSSDTSCDFSGPGDRNDIDPMLGPLANNGGPTQTMALPSGSPAIDAGNPTGCKDANGHLLTTDQRGYPRPDKEDTGACDIGAFEKQSD